MSAPPHCFLVIHNVAKTANIGTLARCATAFGVQELLVVGSSKFNTFGAHGAADYVRVRSFTTLASMREYVTGLGGRVLGVEIVPEALDVTRHPFHGPTAFVLGNEGSGLSPQHMAVCDGFVYIPQFGPGTASLNVAVAAGIVLHHFATWAQYSERDRDGSKFVVDPRPQRTAPRGTWATASPEEVRMQRAVAKEACNAVEDLSGLLSW